MHGSNSRYEHELADGASVYGGFAGSEPNEFDVQNRHFMQNRTYLSGNIDTNGDGDSRIVVKAEDISDSTTTLDGFVITHSIFAGAACDNADILIRNCVFTENDANGLYCYQSDPAVYDSVFVYNGVNGIYDCNESAPIFDRCIIAHNGQNGVRCVRNASLTLINSWIHHNGEDGINFDNAAAGSVIRNNTIAYNDLYGVSVPEGNLPTIKNCIIWNNDSNDLNECSATYSCFDNGSQGTGNTDKDPNFVYKNPALYNFHIDPNSPCRDTGDSGNYPNEVDIDGDNRVVGNKVDMGADEVYTCDEPLSLDDIYNSADWNADGAVNYGEFVGFSRGWLTKDPNDYTVTDPNVSAHWFAYGKQCDIYDDEKIDLADLLLNFLFANLQPVVQAPPYGLLHIHLHRLILQVGVHHDRVRKLKAEQLLK